MEKPGGSESVCGCFLVENFYLEQKGSPETARFLAGSGVSLMNNPSLPAEGGGKMNFEGVESRIYRKCLKNELAIL